MSSLFKVQENMVEQSEIEALEDRLMRVKGMNNNAMGVEMKRFGNAMAFSVKNIPGPSFNTVKGISDENIGDIDEIIDFYTSREIPARFEVTPAYATEELFRKLSQIGFFQSGFYTSLYRSLASEEKVAADEQPSSIVLEKLAETNFNIFGEIYTNGFGMPTALTDYITANNRVLAKSTNWTFYMARAKGEPAGVGVLFRKNDVATLAASTTIPSYRNNGVHTALIQKRIQQAVDTGCQFIMGQAAFGSASHRNMERAGMKIAYTNTVWTKL
ncbi:GNAT family N-acetyltransferase [Sutcliffiella deserti]|uniref:GNAT family N-acetyltransferase n=1 Tax=Sutcliffiella deserti TaxID=2875501 RepID=UPI001CBF3DEC|nr:GNAT family N-acetyltransferase [Sutcliffiella deserti]